MTARVSCVLVAVVPALAMAASCRRRGDIARDRAAASSQTSISAPKTKDAPSRIVFHGDVIDLSKPARIASVGAHVRFASGGGPRDPERFEALHGDVVYFRNGMDDALVAFDIATGAVRWSIPGARCEHLRAVDAGVFCGRLNEDRFYDAGSGELRITASSSAADVRGIQNLEDGGVVTLREDGALARYDRTGAPVAQFFVPAFAEDKDGIEVGPQVMGRLLCAVVVDGDDLTKHCMSDASTSATAIVVTKTYPLRKKGDPPSSDYYLTNFPRYLVFSSVDEDVLRRTIALRREDGVEVARAETGFAGPIEDAAGELEELVAIDAGTATLFDRTGAPRWSVKVPAKHTEAAGVRIGDTIALATYETLVSGGELRGFDAATGALRWTGILQLAARGGVDNRLSVEVVSGRIVVRGEDPFQFFVEIFDPKTGERIFTDEGR